jgi:hypothetical protein
MSDRIYYKKGQYEIFFAEELNCLRDFLDRLDGDKIAALKEMIANDSNICPINFHRKLGIPYNE